MEKKFELGPLQKKWVQYLRDHPEQQISSVLGRKGDDGKIHLCCLGAGLLCAGKGVWNNKNSLLDGEGADRLLDTSYEELGLKDNEGGFYDENGVKYNANDLSEEYESLADMNDSFLNWSEIADFIETNPEVVFTKSV